MNVRPKHILVAILTVSALMRLVSLSSGDLVGSDEVLYSFRSIALVDYVDSPLQTTPSQWLDPNIPAWVGLSFHDHPPLVFWIQHAFIAVFGENNFAVRLPSALFGVASIYILYLIGRRLFNEKTGLIASALYAVTVGGVWISRLALQESYVIFFALLSVHLFTRALTAPRFFLWTGLALGFGLLTKYTLFVLPPFFLFYLLIFQRSAFRRKEFWLGILIALAVFSPVIIYNLEMYKTTGHFDFQFSYALGQNPAVWQSAPGKEEVGTLSDRLRDFLPHLAQSSSPLFLLLFALSIPLFIKKSRLLSLLFVFLILILLVIGPTFRFLTILSPFMALGIALPAVWFLEKFRPAYIFITVVLIFEILYSANSVIAAYPAGPQFWAFSKIRSQNYHWGYNQLEGFFNEELSGKYPLLTFDLQYQFLQKLKEEGLAAEKNGNAPYPALIVYDPNIDSAGQLWSFDRRQIYHGWPVMSADAYLAAVKANGPDYFKNAGLRAFYFVFPTDKVLLKDPDRLTAAGPLLESQIAASGKAFLIRIANDRSEDAFHIYRIGPI